MNGRKKATHPENDGDPTTNDSVVSLKRQDEVSTPSHVFTLTDSEVERKVFQLRYHTCNDAYYRLGSETAVIEGWENGSYAAVNIARHDHNDLAYLTRVAGHRRASISWKVDLTDSGLVVDSIQALTLSRTLPGGIITYDIVSPDADKHADQSGNVTNGWQTLYLIAYLSGSRTADSYDQTQLLYQAGAEDQDNFPLDILLTLKPLQEILCTCPQDSTPFSKAGTREVVEVHSPTIEQCTCFFPNSAPGFSGRPDRQRTPSGTGAMESLPSADSLSIVNKHAISLPGTPIHRKQYGSRASSGSGRSRRLTKKNRVQSSSDQRGYDNSGVELTPSTPSGDPTAPPDHSALRVLEVGDLEAMGSKQGTEARRAWSDRKERDSESLVVEDDPGSSRRFCKGTLCTIS